jgi:transposase
MTSPVGRGTRRRKRHVKPSRAGPIFRADRKAAQLRRQAWNFTGGRRRRWRQTMRRTKDADLRRRYQIVWLWAEGFTKTAIAQMLCCHRNTVAKVLQAFPDKGELGLVDGRVANGPLKVTPAFVGQVKQLIAGSPDPKWNHTTWTEELLTLVLAEQTGIAVSVSTLCRVLKRLTARKGRPRPVVRCP